jgi:aldehyde dehydrogenase
MLQKSIDDNLMEKAVARAKKIKQSHPLDPSTRVGTQASNDQLEKILSYLDIGKSPRASMV